MCTICQICVAFVKISFCARKKSWAEMLMKSKPGLIPDLFLSHSMCRAVNQKVLLTFFVVYSTFLLHSDKMILQSIRNYKQLLKRSKKLVMGRQYQTLKYKLYKITFSAFCTLLNKAIYHVINFLTNIIIKINCDI